MLILTVRVGEVLTLGDIAAIKVFERKGQSVTFGLLTSVAPVEVITTGVIPARFTTGIHREKRAPSKVAVVG